MSPIQELASHLISSFSTASLVKLVAASPLASSTAYRKITVTPAIVKRVPMLSLTSYTATQAFVKNYLGKELEHHLVYDVLPVYNNIILTTTAGEYHLNRVKSGKEKLSFIPAANPIVPITSHNQQKNYLASPSEPFFQYLGITDPAGNIIPARQNKFKQVNQFLSLLRPHIQKMPASASFTAFDMGSGKGYLTFALYSLLQREYSDLKVTGIEARQDLSDTCNAIAEKCSYTGLSFRSGRIDTLELPREPSLVMALHACDTATDDALALAIRAQTGLIVVAPCCHKQVRKSLKLPATSSLSPLLKHGIFKERQAEMLTDAIRALVLQYYGYHVEVAEFISAANTPKNLMIIARRVLDKIQPQFLSDIAGLQETFGLTAHYLVQVLNLSLPAYSHPCQTYK